jgi:5-enolpyruvylshikimate-3-phosphate synthase
MIEGAEAVNKSYPNFWEDMQSLGTVISKQLSVSSKQ